METQGQRHVTAVSEGTEIATGIVSRCPTEPQLYTLEPGGEVSTSGHCIARNMGTSYVSYQVMVICIAGAEAVSSGSPY